MPETFSTSPPSAPAPDVCVPRLGWPFVAGRAKAGTAQQGAARTVGAHRRPVPRCVPTDRAPVKDAVPLGPEPEAEPKEGGDGDNLMKFRRCNMFEEGEAQVWVL